MRQLVVAKRASAHADNVQVTFPVCASRGLSSPSSITVSVALLSSLSLSNSFCSIGSSGLFADQQPDSLDVKQHRDRRRPVCHLAASPVYRHVHCHRFHRLKIIEQTALFKRGLHSQARPGPATSVSCPPRTSHPAARATRRQASYPCHTPLEYTSVHRPAGDPESTSAPALPYSSAAGPAFRQRHRSLAATF